jgi:hypothetical protein
MPAAVPAAAASAPALATPAAAAIADSSDATPAVIKRSGMRISVAFVGVCLLILAAAGGGVLYFQYGGLSLSASPTPAATTGSVKIVSRPAGAKVTVDGVPRGVAPIDLTLTPGQHRLDVDHGGTKRTLPLAIEAGTIVRQYVDFAAPAPTAGRLEITSDPPGAQVLVDDVPSGTTPLSLGDVAPGSHTIVIGTGPSAVTRAVEVTAGATAAVVASIGPATGAAGWIAIKAPMPVELREGGRVVAAAGVERVMLPTGRHELEVIADDFEFRATIMVNVIAGRTVTPGITVPEGRLSINAAPWAEVWLDGKEMGTTPLGNLSVPIGMHEIVWKHPQFGERRQTVKVTAQTPVRASMDFGR